MYIPLQCSLAGLSTVLITEWVLQEETDHTNVLGHKKWGFEVQQQKDDMEN
jgi:hypothetical protein